MDIKDYHMTAEELTLLTKYLTIAIAEQIDWDLAESRILELFGPINDDQRSAIHQMIEESKATNSAAHVIDEHMEEVVEMYQDLMDDDDTDQEEPEEE